MCIIRRIVQQMTDKGYKVVDNYLKELDFEILKAYIFCEEMPWYYNKKITFDDEDSKFYYYVHLLYMNNKPNSNHFHDVIKFFDFYNCLYRVKINSYPNQGQFVEHSMHYDYKFEHKGALYSLNSCDGYTKIGNDRIESVENRMIFFDPTKLHASTNTTDDLRRVNINFNYI